MAPRAKETSAVSARAECRHGVVHIRCRFLPIIAAASMILILTLAPGSWFVTSVGDPPPIVSFKFLLSDFLANWILYLLFGASVGRATRSPLAALACALLLSAVVETAQIAIPFRFTNPFDVVANAAGGFTGAVLWSSSQRWKELTDNEASWSCALLSGLLASVILLSNLLLMPAPPAGRYFVHAPPQIRGFEFLPGEILRITLNGAHLDGSPIPDSQQVRAALAGDFELRLRARLESPPTRPSLIFMISAEPEKELVLMLRIEGDDLVLGYRALSNEFHLEAIEVRANGLLRSIESQQTFETVVRRQGHRTCLKVDSLAYCKGDLSIAQVWALYLPQLEWLFGRSPLVSFAWIGLWSVALGGLARLHWASAVGIGLLVVALVATTHFGPLQPLSNWEILTTLLSFAIGIAARRLCTSARSVNDGVLLK